MSSHLAPLSSSLSDHQFVGDLASLLERRKLKCGDAQSLDKFASELVSSDALRSDLFALCSAISHLSAEDLSADELLVLVARALRGPEAATDGAVPAIPETVRSTFQEAYEQWSQCRSTVVESSPWPAERVTAMFDATSRVDKHAAEGGELASSLVVDGELAESLLTIQAALGMVRRWSLEEPIAEDPARGEDLSLKAVGRETATGSFGGDTLRISFAGQAQHEGDGPRLGVLLSVRGLIVCAFLLAVVSGFTGGYVYQSLHSGTVRIANGKVVPQNGAEGRVVPAVFVAAATGDAMPVDVARSLSAGAAKPAVQIVARKAASSEAQQSVLSRLDQQSGARHVVSAKGPSGGAASDPATKPVAAPVPSEVAELTSQLSGLPHVPPTAVMAYAMSAPTPVYPADQPRGISGTVTVEVSISRQGNVTGAWAVSGPDELRAAAIQAVQAWRFRPYLIDGNPAEVTTTVGFFFNGR